MKKNKIVLISGLSTAGKTTISYNLAKKLPNWIFIDIWKIKDIFEPLALKERKDIIAISKKTIIMLTHEALFYKRQKQILLKNTLEKI